MRSIEAVLLDKIGKIVSVQFQLYCPIHEGKLIGEGKNAFQVYSYYLMSCDRGKQFLPGTLKAAQDHHLAVNVDKGDHYCSEYDVVIQAINDEPVQCTSKIEIHRETIGTINFTKSPFTF